MKKYYLLFTVTTLMFSFSCSPGVEIQRTVISSGYDFRPYTEQNFLFTPEAYQGEYESIGLLYVEIIPEVKRANYGENSRINELEWEFIRSRSGDGVWKVKRFSSKEILDELYKEATKMGANAVVNLKFENIENSNGAITFYGIGVSGLAIKRITE